jgi:AraC family transcriptional regulator
LSQLLDYIHHHLDQDITVTDLAAIANMSRYYFASLFKQSTGVAPYQYVLIQRVERAKQLLKQPEFSLAEIASASGFANQSHFTRQFRQLTGVTPKTYRDTLSA